MKLVFNIIIVLIVVVSDVVSIDKNDLEIIAEIQKYMETSIDSSNSSTSDLTVVEDNNVNTNSSKTRIFQQACTGKRYNIQTPDDLMRYQTELECIFRQGFAPSKFPVGPWQGSVIQVFNTVIINAIASFFWFGKMALKTTCNGEEAIVGWNNLRNIPVIPFVGRVGPLNEVMGNGEFDDGRDSVIVDYCKDVAKVCPEFIPLTQGRNTMRNTYPFNHIIDVLRIVGWQLDGSAIYLGKMLMRNGRRSSRHVNNLAFFGIVNYDPEVYPERHDYSFQPQDPIPGDVNRFRDQSNLTSV